KSPEFVQLRLGQRRAERRYRGGKTRAVQRDDVHIPFGDNDGRRLAIVAASGVGPRRGPGVEHAALLEQRRIRRLQVFWLIVAQSSAAEGDDPAGPVADREDDPAAEVVVRRAAALGLAQQAAFE